MKEKRVSFSEKQEEVRNRINALSPLGGVTERPQSRGGMAFDIMLVPETGNVKRRPQHLRSLERRKKKGARRTKEEIEEKLKHAEERRRVRVRFILTIFQNGWVIKTTMKLLFDVKIIRTRQNRFLQLSLGIANCSP